MLDGLFFLENMIYQRKYRRKFNYCVFKFCSATEISESLLLNVAPFADSEHVFCNGTMGHEHDCRPVEYNDNVLDSIGLKSGNVTVKENENGELHDLKGMEGDADRLPNVAPVLSPHSSLKMEPFEDSVFYMDKSVLEREVPELIVCYKENTCHVKDICIDEGVPLLDKFLFDTDAHEKNVCEFLPSARDMNNEMVKEKSDLDMLIPDVLKSSPEKQNANIHLPVPDMLKSSEEQDLKCELSLDYNPKHLVPTEEVMAYVTEKVANDAPKEILSLRDLLSMPEFGANFTSTKSNHSMDKVEQHSLQVGTSLPKLFWSAPNSQLKINKEKGSLPLSIYDELLYELLIIFI